MSGNSSKKVSGQNGSLVRDSGADEIPKGLTLDLGDEVAEDLNKYAKFIDIPPEETVAIENIRDYDVEFLGDLAKSIYYESKLQPCIGGHEIGSSPAESRVGSKRRGTSKTSDKSLLERSQQGSDSRPSDI